MKANSPSLRGKPASSVAQFNHSHWVETGCVVAVAALILLLANWSAFSGHFFAENFQHLGVFRGLDNCLACLLTAPTLDLWYRPVDAVFTVISFEVLPLTPFPFHLRNYFLLLTNLLLFHRCLVEIVPERLPRLLAVAMVAVSKVQFTMIGYINLFGSILVTTWILVAALFFIRFIRHHNYRDYALALIASGLAIFTKETGVSVLVVLAALLFSYAEPVEKPLALVRRLALYFIPVGLAIAAFFVIRTAVAGSPVQTSGVYAPRLSLDILWRNGLAFFAALGNVAVVEEAAMGKGGIAAYLAGRLGLGPSLVAAADALVLLLLVALLGAIWLRTRSTCRQWVMPLAWMGVVFAMVLTIRNLQIYYIYDFVLAFGVLLATLLVRAARLTRACAVGAVVLIGLNGVVSNAVSTYSWQFSANQAAEATRQVAAVCGRPASCDHIVFVTSNVDQWRFMIGAAAPYPPMLPELLGRPDLRISYVPEETLVANLLGNESGLVILNVDQGFSRVDGAQAAPVSAPIIVDFGPTQVKAGRHFNIQPNGSSALWFRVKHATPDTLVVFAGTPLSTVVAQGQNTVSALLDMDLYSHPGRYPMYLRNRLGQSNEVVLVVDP